jgi:ABC-2 type transport system permease protein
MSTMTLEQVRPKSAASDTPIPATRVVSVELRKMFDTRSGFWLLMSVAISAILATGAVILWAPDSNLTYDTFAAAIGFPMAVILPMVAILSVTSEWTQRSGLSTFTLIPHRGRVIAAKAVATVIIAVASMIVAMVIGALGNVLGTAITGTPTVWDASFLQLAEIVLANVLGMLLGFMLGMLIRNSAGAIVAYFVVSFVLTALSELLAGNSAWWFDNRPWVDFNVAQGVLFNGEMAALDWAHLATATVIWLVIPLALGLRLMMRSEVK